MKRKDKQNLLKEFNYFRLFSYIDKSFELIIKKFIEIV
jgi:hypothetical protein